MKISVKFFASYREKTGQALIHLTLDRTMTIRDLKGHLVGLYPGLNPLFQNAVGSINLNFAMDDEMVEDGVEVAFFPPVSGGSGNETIIRVDEDQIRIDEITTQLTQSTTGAVCTFTGVVRGETQNGSFPLTSWLEYEAYVPMARAKLEQIAIEMREKWPQLESIALIQRVGKINPGISSVLVGCAASHRNLGIFEAAHYGINRIKEIVPVWKKEVSPDGEEWVEGDYHPGKGD
jgi:MoaE-MoaD fusion protein